MRLYDIVVNRIREIQELSKDKEPVTNLSASATLAAEITLISTVLIAAIMLRKINDILMIVVVLGLFIALIAAMPIMPRLRKEQSDSFNSMIFYVLLALTIIITLFYWGVRNV